MASLRPIQRRAGAILGREWRAPIPIASSTRAYHTRLRPLHFPKKELYINHTQARASSTTPPTPTPQNQEQDSKGNVWHVADAAGTSYWDEYLATRPKYDSRIFGPLTAYHSSNGGLTSSALDIGSGAGSAVEGLLKHFDNVVSTDNDPMSQDFTRKRFHNVPGERLRYTLSKGEDLAEYHEKESFDLITCAETFPLLDLKQAQDTILTLLRPGGTLALWFYGPPFFVDGKDPQEATRIFQEIVDMNFKPVVSGRPAAERTSWKQAADGMHSWLDYVPVPSSHWTNIQRHKWNSHIRLAFFGERACDFPIEPKSAVGKGEKIEEHRDDDFWQVSWDINKLRQFVRASFPRSNWYEADQEFGPMFEKLAEAMGDGGKARKMSWPAVLVLAQKKRT